MSLACEIAGIPRSSAYHERGTDERFREAWDDALARSVDQLEQEAFRRATEGVAKPIFYKGERCGSVQEFSDGLALALLRAHRPERYAKTSTETQGESDNVRIEILPRPEPKPSG